MDKLLKYMKNKKIGNTPIVYYNNIYYKLELFNPSGSIKDRAAYNILKEYYKMGIIKKGSTIVLATSGNMGISMAYFAGKFKINVSIVMPDNVSKMRLEILKKYGATIILTSSVDGMGITCEFAERLAKEKGYIFINQFENIYNKLAHISTSKEIEKELPNVDYIIVGIGSGGTISGLCEYFKNSKVKIIGVEPYESSIISKGKKGKHSIEGIGAGFIPPLIDLNDIYKVERVKSKEVIEKFENDNPLLLGKSSIACEIVGRKILKKEPNAKILVIAADGIDRYDIV